MYTGGYDDEQPRQRPPRRLPWCFVSDIWAARAICWSGMIACVWIGACLPDVISCRGRRNARFVTTLA